MRIGSNADIDIGSRSVNVKINKKEVVKNWLMDRSNAFQVQQEEQMKVHYHDERKKRQELQCKRFMFFQQEMEDGCSSVFDHMQGSKLHQLKSRQQVHQRSITQESPRDYVKSVYNKNKYDYNSSTRVKSNDMRSVS